ncbi:hypothetical protein AA0111_g4532 [Alternaria arborescens]|uniref:hypothetical protein n=1 Tax=Alternaria arborescens TaxID=156630 RepID=UPI0010752D7E|nr:hypothetical protein AA0111_g4532 [Alternaria arborescens]RYO32752.1 hypothetical protein AA0111_g4532 [Alternaria arborescens]
MAHHHELTTVSSGLYCDQGPSNRNIAVEAYQTAIEHLKNELDISLNVPVPSKFNASVKDVFSVVETAKKEYEDRSREHKHTGMKQSLERLSSRIMYYGKVMDTLAQHHPEYVALVWGAMKLVLTGVINRATLFEKLSQALIDIANVLPRMNLSAELYQTKNMEAALSRLFTYIILFLRLCVRWYKKSPLGRMCSAIKTPFELGYQDLVEHIRECSKAVDDLANAGARVEIRDVRTLTELQHAQIRELDLKLLKVLEEQENFKAQVVQLLQVATSHKSVTERIGVDVCSISRTVYRIEFNGVMQFFEPKVLPETALLKVQSFMRRDLTPSLPGPNEQKVRKKILGWALGRGSSLLVVQVGLRAQKQAKELATNVINSLKLGSQCVFWNLPLTSNPSDPHTMAEMFRSIIFQALQHSGDLFNSFSEQLNLSKINATHTEGEWVDLICLLFSKISTAFIVIETEALQKVYQHDSSWDQRLSGYLQQIIDQSSAAGCELKLLVIMYGNCHRFTATAASSKNVHIAKMQPPTPAPPHLRHVARRSGLIAKGWKMQRPKGRS